MTASDEQTAIFLRLMDELLIEKTLDGYHDALVSQNVDLLSSVYSSHVLVNTPNMEGTLPKNSVIEMHKAEWDIAIYVESQITNYKIEFKGNDRATVVGIWNYAIKQNGFVQGITDVTGYSLRKIDGTWLIDGIAIIWQ